jgi:hypothetical protein
MPPTNQTMATAMEITSLPFSITQNLTGVVGFGGFEYDLWYKIPAALITAAISADRLVGARGYLTIAHPDYFTQTWMYTDPPIGNYGTPYLDAKSNTFGDGRLQVPLADTPQDYYLMLYTEDFTGIPPTYDVTMEVYLSDENLPIPAGSLFINNDEPGFPAAALSTADGSILAFIHDIAAGETGDILPNGIMALADTDTNDTKIYNPDFTLRATVPLTGNISSGNQVDRFYIITYVGTIGTLRSFDADGNIGATSWGPLPANSQMSAVSRDETIAYLTDVSAVGAGGGVVRRWDLINNVALSNLAAAVPSYILQSAGVSPGGVLVIADGTILVSYFRANQNDSFIRHYSAAGAVLHTYSFIFPSTWTGLDRIAHDPTDDSLTFWTWVKGGGANFGRGRFERVRISDGVALISVNHSEAQFGYQQRPAGDNTSEQFSHPFSCPFLLLREAFTPEPPRPPLPGGCPANSMEPRTFQGLDGCPGTL